MSRRNPWLEEIPTAMKIFYEVLGVLNKEENFEEGIRSGRIEVSKALRKLHDKCYEKYLEYETSIKKKWSPKIEADKLEMSLSQSRVARAGDTIEIIIHYLLRVKGIPNERKVRYPRKNGELLDIVVPNREVLKSNPAKAVIISVKRNVRERWREVAGEAYILRKIHSIPDNIWFVTSECDLSSYIINSLIALEIRVYVPDECYKEFEQFGARPLSNILGDLLTILQL